MWKCNGPRVTKIILKKENKFERLILPDFKSYHGGKSIEIGFPLGGDKMF